MSIGAVGITTTQKKEPAPQSGFPFTTGSARNGTSIDSTGRVVLGNDVGAAGDPAILLSNREIKTEDGSGGLPFSLILNSPINTATTDLNGLRILLTAGDFATPHINITSGDTGASNINLNTGPNGTSEINIASPATGVSVFELRADADRYTVTSGGFGEIMFQNAGITVMRWVTATFTMQVGPTLTFDNGADFQINGTTTFRHLVEDPGAGAYNVNRDLDTNKQFINSGATTFNLPNMAGANNRMGFVFRVCCKNAGGVTVQASAGQVIRFGSLATSSGGTLATTDVGAYLMLIWDNSNWITASFLGAWTLT